MPSRTRFKCLCCRELHFCDSRNRDRQHYCDKPGCRKASKAASQKRWAAKSENKDYFRGGGHVERVRCWRAAHPGYWRKKRVPKQDALQETCSEQHPVDELDALKSPAVALQDTSLAQPALIVGLISFLTGYALQEDIAASVRMFQSRGADILRMGRWVSAKSDYENQTDTVCGAAEARAAPI
jgi:hypothetical protein